MTYTHRNTQIPESVSPKIEQAIAPELLQELRESWQETRQHLDRGTHAERYNQAIARVRRAIGISRRDGNAVIDWLDAHYPDWRGYPAPKCLAISEVEYEGIQAYLVVSKKSDRPAAAYLNQEVA